MTPVFPLVPDQQEIRQTLRDLKVAGAMTIEPVVISPDATLLSAAKELLERRIGSLLVAEDDHLLGILSVSDILRIVIEQHEG
jgi:CBS domain-containing protein